MSTAVLPTRHRAGASATPWTGTATLLRLALRRDRIRLTVWLGLLTLLMAYTPGALEMAYPAAEQRLARVNLMQTPPAPSWAARCSAATRPHWAP